VKDTGIGIQSCNLDKIFAPFSQVKRDDRGSGLGLALVKQLAESIDGKGWAESQGIGQGSTFVLLSPISKFSNSVYVTDCELTPQRNPLVTTSDKDSTTKRENLAVLLAEVRSTNSPF
jgi:hypothetical protein